ACEGELQPGTVRGSRGTAEAVHHAIRPAEESGEGLHRFARLAVGLRSARADSLLVAGHRRVRAAGSRGDGGYRADACEARWLRGHGAGDGWSGFAAGSGGELRRDEQQLSGASHIWGLPALKSEINPGDGV